MSHTALATARGPELPETTSICLPWTPTTIPTCAPHSGLSTPQTTASPTAGVALMPLEELVARAAPRHEGLGGAGDPGRVDARGTATPTGRSRCTTPRTRCPSRTPSSCRGRSWR